MKFTLISDNEFGGPKITFEFEEDFLDSVVENIEQFLKGSGFVFESLEVNQESSESSSWDDHDDDDDDDDDDDEEKLEENRFFINTDENMSTTWPFPLDRPSDTITLTPGNK